MTPRRLGIIAATLAGLPLAAGCGGLLLGSSAHLAGLPLPGATALGVAAALGALQGLAAWLLPPLCRRRARLAQTAAASTVPTPEATRPLPKPAVASRGCPGAVSALKNLGLPKAQAEAAVSAALAQGAPADNEAAVIRLALRASAR